MLKLLSPTYLSNSVFTIDYDILRSKGYDCLLFDVDNTLAPDGGPIAPEISSLFKNLAARGFRIVLISNGSPERVAPFGSKAGVKYIYRAGKPGTGGIKKALKSCRAKSGKTVLVGDQIFSDILAANRAGIASCLVRPVDPDEPWIVRIKRPLEKIVRHRIEQAAERI